MATIDHTLATIIISSVAAAVSAAKKHAARLPEQTFGRKGAEIHRETAVA
jgi:hypothetical protein